MTTNQAALIYVRVSTDERTQASMPDQISLCQARATALGLPPVPPQDIYRDEMSRSIFGRPGLQDMLARIAKDAGVTHVIVWQTSRLYGDVEQKVRIYRTLRARKVRLFSAAGDEENLPGAMQEAFSSLKAVLHQLEVEVVRERVHDMHSVKAGAGVILQKPVFGIGWDADRKYHIDEEQALQVRLIFDWLAEGKTPQWVCDELNARGVRTMEGCEWRRHNLRRMVRNPIYAGLLVWNRTQTVIVDDKRRQVARPESEWIRSVSPLGPLVEQATFDEAGRQLTLRWRQRGGGRGVRTYDARILTGLVWCDRCKKKMYARRNRHGGKAFYFTCAAQCQTIAESKLMSALTDEAPSDPDLQRTFRLAPQSDDEADQLADQLKAVERRIERNYASYLDEDVSKELYRATRGQLEHQRRTIGRAISALAGRSEIDETMAASEMFKDLPSLLTDKAIPLEERRALLSRALDRIVVNRPGLDIRLREGATFSRP